MSSPIVTVAAAATLHRLVREGTILHFETNFESVRKVGTAPEVHVWIREPDDRSAARARKMIRDALYPHLEVVAIRVFGGSLVGAR